MWIDYTARAPNFSRWSVFNFAYSCSSYHHIIRDVFLRLDEAKIEFYSLNLVLHANCAPLSARVCLHTCKTTMGYTLSNADERRGKKCALLKFHFFLLTHALNLELGLQVKNRPCVSSFYGRAPGMPFIFIMSESFGEPADHLGVSERERD